MKLTHSFEISETSNLKGNITSQNAGILSDTAVKT